VSSSEDSNEQVGYTIRSSPHGILICWELVWPAVGVQVMIHLSRPKPPNTPQTAPSETPAPNPSLVESIAMALCRAARFLLNFIRVRHMHNTRTGRSGPTPDPDSDPDPNFFHTSKGGVKKQRDG